MVDEELERAIDEVGRDRVFARARRRAWEPGSALPPWVWWGIVYELTLEQVRAPAGGYRRLRLVVDNTDRGVPPT
jgi:hypothetical protein